MSAIQSIIRDPTSTIDTLDAWLKQAKTLTSGELAQQLMELSIDDLTKTTELRPDFMNKFFGELPAEGLDILEGKVNPTGARALPGTASHWAIVAKTNMRQRSNWQLLLVGMIGYLRRALEERARPDAAERFDRSYTPEQKELIGGFLDDLFEYDPNASIDRYTSELYTPKEAKLKGKRTEKSTFRAETATVEAEAVTTRVKDRLKRYGVGTSKYTEEERSRATVKFDGADAAVTIDPPSDFFGKFMTYYNTHFDAIYRICWEIFLEGRAAESFIGGKNIYVRERVTLVQEERDPATGAVVKSEEFAKFEFPAPNKQWEDTIMVVSPEDGQFFKSKEQAAEQIRKYKGLTISDLFIVATNATVMTASWHAGKREIITDDDTTNALMKRLERDSQVYAKLNKKRVEDAKFREMIAEGPDANEFTDYMRQTNPNFSHEALDDQDNEELMRRYREFKETHKIFGNDDPNFMLYLKRVLPHRNLDKQPLSVEERKKFSRAFVTSADAPELSQTSEKMALDFFEIGGPDPENAGPEMRREYVEAMETVFM